MSSLVKDCKNRSPFWIACYTDATGRRVKKSTKQTGREKAQRVLLSLLDIDTSAKESATEKQLRKVIDDLLIRLGEKKLSDHTVRQHLDHWLADKKGSLAPASLSAYTTSARSLCEYLGPKADKSVRLLDKAAVVGFRDALPAEGRRPLTVNKVIGGFLASAFQDLCEDGTLASNPFALASGLKANKVQRAFSARNKSPGWLRPPQATNGEG